MTPEEMRDAAEGYEKAIASDAAAGRDTATGGVLAGTLWLVAAELCERLDRIAERGEQEPWYLRTDGHRQRPKGGG